MIYFLGELVEFYKVLFGESPMWLTAVFIVMHAAAFLWCRAMGRHVGWKDYNGIRNIFSTAFWLLVIVLFPFAGILAYILLSFVPYCIIRKKTRGTMKGFFFCETRPRVIFAIILGGIAGKLIQLAIDKNPPDNELFNTQHMETAAAFLVFIAVMTADALMTFRKKGVYVRLSPAGEEPVYGQDDRILGYRQFDEVREDIEGEYRCIETLYRSYVGDIYPLQGSPAAEMTQEVTAGDKAYSFELNGCNVPVSLFSDVYEVKYNLRSTNTAELHVIDMDGSVFRKHVVYLILPKIRFFIARTAVELFVLTALFTPVFAGVHMALSSAVFDFINLFV